MDPGTTKKLVYHPNLPMWVYRNSYAGVALPMREAASDLVLIAF